MQIHVWLVLRRNVGKCALNLGANVQVRLSEKNANVGVNCRIRPSDPVGTPNSGCCTLVGGTSTPQKHILDVMEVAPGQSIGALDLLKQGPERVHKNTTSEGKSI